MPKGLKGGQSAADYAQSTYGNYPQQMAQLEQGNLLRAAGQPVKGGSCGVPFVKGGGPLAQVAVPAVLLVANNRFAKTKKCLKKFKMGKRMRFKSRKFRGSRREKR